jgi:hypothetical protein
MPAFHEVYAFGPFTTLLANTTLNMGKFKLRVEQYTNVAPNFTNLDRPFRLHFNSKPLKVLPSSPSNPVASPSNIPHKSKGMAYLHQVGGFAELEVTKLYSQVCQSSNPGRISGSKNAYYSLHKAHQDAVHHAKVRVEETYVSTMRTTVKQYKVIAEAVNTEQRSGDWNRYPPYPKTLQELDPKRVQDQGQRGFRRLLLGASARFN